MSERQPSRNIAVAVFVYDYSTSGVAYSGGRYHALLLAYAMAYGGINVTVVADRQPAFVADLQATYGTSVKFVFTSSYDASAVPGSFDYVFVAPTGGFNPAFYACAEAVAGRSKATPVLINYESANWFNSLAPAPDHLDVWDYWRRTVVGGGVVLSSTLESDAHARHYYHSDGRLLQFAHCYPPLNSRAAALAFATREGKDGALIYFARPCHDHKGGADILELRRDLYAGRVLRVVFGGQVDGTYCNQLKAMLEECGGRLEVHSQITEDAKFRLLAHSNLLLFPSRFEGFGYPPLEAALVGTESVCYGLPVLRETLSDTSHFAPLGDIRAFVDEAQRALRISPRGCVLRDRAESVAGFDRIARQVSHDVASWKPVPATADQHVVMWGPWASDEIRAGRSTSPQDDAPLPSYGQVTASPDGALAAVIILWARESIADATLRGGGFSKQALSVKSSSSLQNWRRTEITFRLHQRHLRQRLRLVCFDDYGKLIHEDSEVMVCEVNNSGRLE